ncbi:MAG: vWA domain-containing protein [Myxococcota bacterium]
MRRDLTDITLVVDRSGSMHSIRDDAQGGINALIADQAKQPGDALITLVQFDTEYEFVHTGVPVREVPPYTLVPRGSTALLDAVGRAIGETGARLAALPEDQRPGLVAFVVATDGHENSSRELTKAQVREMIEHQQTVYQWQFTFLGAGADAFAEAGGMGIDRAGVARYAREKIGSAYSATSAKLNRMRTATSAGEDVSNAFTDDELDEMN